LTAREVTTLPDGMHRDGGNLFLWVRNGGKARSWLFRYTFNRRQMPPLSLGSAFKLTVSRRAQGDGTLSRLIGRR
jgi:hypothetical protein